MGLKLSFIIVSFFAALHKNYNFSVDDGTAFLEKNSIVRWLNEELGSGALFVGTGGLVAVLLLFNSVVPLLLGALFQLRLAPASSLGMVLIGTDNALQWGVRYAVIWVVPYLISLVLVPWYLSPELQDGFYIPALRVFGTFLLASLFLCSCTVQGVYTLTRSAHLQTKYRQAPWYVTRVWRGASIVVRTVCETTSAHDNFSCRVAVVYCTGTTSTPPS